MRFVRTNADAVIVTARFIVHVRAMTVSRITIARNATANAMFRLMLNRRVRAGDVAVARGTGAGANANGRIAIAIRFDRSANAVAGRTFANVARADAVILRVFARGFRFTNDASASVYADCSVTCATVANDTAARTVRFIARRAVPFAATAFARTARAARTTVFGLFASGMARATFRAVRAVAVDQPFAVRLVRRAVRVGRAFARVNTAVSRANTGVMTFATGRRNGRGRSVAELPSVAVRSVRRTVRVRRTPTNAFATVIGANANGNVVMTVAGTRRSATSAVVG